MSEITKTIFATYGHSTWPVILYSDGRLTCKGPGYGSWGTREVSISDHVQDVWAAGTDQGPGILYQRRNSLEAVFLRFNTGANLVASHVSNKAPSAVRVEPHQYGVIFYVMIEDRLLRVDIDGWGHLKIE